MFRITVKYGDVWVMGMRVGLRMLGGGNVLG